MPIKSFRGKLADGGIDKVVLHTNTGSTGYKITKFQLFAPDPGNSTQESVVKIYKIPQTTTTATVDFSDNTMLASAYYKDNSSDANPTSFVVVFDNEIFNQDIYITCNDPGAGTNESMNYYIELETVKLSLDENTVATLKDIRNIEAQNV
tara:strand:- start:251 stop:700 length:450 start_codon:yes stop_codon:yes gene_type:complete